MPVLHQIQAKMRKKKCRIAKKAENALQFQNSCKKGQKCKGGVK